MGDEHYSRCKCEGCTNKRPRSFDLTGMRFKKLIVLEKLEKRSATREVLWRCLCDCGNKISVSTTKLRSRGALSCGCLKKEMRLGAWGKKWGFV